MCGDRVSQLSSTACLVDIYLVVVFGGGFATRFSKWWFGAVLRWGGVFRARYLTISVVLYKKADNL